MKYKKCQTCRNLRYNIPETGIEKDIETGGKNECVFRASCDGSNFYSSLEKEEMNGGHSLSYNQNTTPMPADACNTPVAYPAKESSFLVRTKDMHSEGRRATTILPPPDDINYSHARRYRRIVGTVTDNVLRGVTYDLAAAESLQYKSLHPRNGGTASFGVLCTRVRRGETTNDMIPFASASSPR